MIEYLFQLFTGYQRNPTDAELFAYAQGNSEHCHHGTFNGLHIIGGQKMEQSLFRSIKDTHATHPNRTLSAYKDNAAAVSGSETVLFFVDESGRYVQIVTPLANTLKVETHNHPTGISPFAGAATGSGGEIRDDGSVGTGSIPNAGSNGFLTSNLRLPRLREPWEKPGVELPEGRATALEIMTQGPLGSAAFNNEFGRPSITGTFRTMETEVGGVNWGYHKPTMYAGGKGNVLPGSIEKKELIAGSLIIQLGGPGMNIGLGGGSGSSSVTGSTTVELDFASVQRENPEMQRRAHEVILSCAKMFDTNPILSIHDVGAGGIGNALQEIVHGAGMGAKIHFEKIPVADPSLSPLETWSNESQERYVLAIDPKDLPLFESICKRENAPFAVVGEIQEGSQFTVTDNTTGKAIIEFDLGHMLDHNVPLELRDSYRKIDGGILDLESMGLRESLGRVLRHPAVADKSFLITIGDRTVGGNTFAEQMIGPWQVPVGNVGVTRHGMYGNIGEIITQGERAPLAIVNPAASVRMAFGEAMTNLMAASVEDFQSIILSGNWMAAAREMGQLSALYEGVNALKDIAIATGVSVPVGKDSLSMKTVGRNGQVISPLTAVISAHAETLDASKTLTPELKRDAGETELLLIDLSEGKNRIGASILAQVWNQFGNEVPDVDNPELLLNFMKAMRELHEKGLLLAYHDRSDGGLFATLSEMSFASHAGIDIDISMLLKGKTQEEVMRTLFNEELGAVVQFQTGKKDEILAIFAQYGLGHIVHTLGKPNFEHQILKIRNGEEEIINERRIDLQKQWSRVSYEISHGRENPETARAEFARIDDEHEPVMPEKITFDIKKHEAWELIQHAETNNTPKPKMAVLRTQGTNGHVEMARYFINAGFEVVDLHLNDLMTGKYSLSDFSGISIAGGFSYGDALGAGVGFATVIRENEDLRKQFQNFGGFIFGVCNGCQVISQMSDILPDGDNFPKFRHNTSGKFEARRGVVSITEKAGSTFFKGMDGSILPIISSHGEGRVEGNIDANIHYVDHHGNPTNSYPHNPNGSQNGATGYEFGRVGFLMGHPEREVDENSPWLQIPLNLRLWVEKNMSKK